MFSDVVKFLNEAQKSDEQFAKLLEFYKFKDKIAHKQTFNEVCKEVASFFKQLFHTSSMKITTYDIEKSFESTLFLYGNDIKNLNASNVIKYDFSKSYALNGRIYFEVIDLKILEEINQNKSFLNFMFYEIKQILLNFLAIDKIKENTFVDEITGLPNRRFLINHLRSLFEIAKNEGFKIGLLKVDVDHFKAIIEEFNYEIGNQVLKRITKVLQEKIAKTDIVTKFEGNTFLVCMQDLKDTCDAEKLAHSAIETFAKEFIIVNKLTSQKLFKTISIGIAIYPQDGENFDDLFRNVDIALDEAKNKGRSSYEFYKKEQNCTIDLF